MYISYYYNRLKKKFMIHEGNMNRIGLYPSESQWMIPGTVDPRE
ncbi:hypothetical protein [Rhizobium phage RHph_X2_28B]|nr:hypothetical protein PP751_gp099 [Rhizobium phage RHph_X2_28B]QWY83548.1 hypothetical protein [Rhizobium phage RHph_X2_28B]QWY83784.1 hypothetical protein [Rhizobium phage RHph_X3_15]